MFEIIFWSVIIVGGSITYKLLGGESWEENKTTNTKDKENHYKDTYDYFMKLNLEEQHEYIDYNLDLNYYKDELKYDNKESTAREVARRAEKYGKTFNNRYKKY